MKNTTYSEACSRRTEAWTRMARFENRPNHGIAYRQAVQDRIEATEDMLELLDDSYRCAVLRNEVANLDSLLGV
tara:strand:+ start:15793 stop:16014 length:222 start_codon:yes stop_codon:yes gene_type:complete